MTYLEAALQVLTSSRTPLTTGEITERALREGLISPHGKTPTATMSAKLYLALRNNDHLVKLEERAAVRAKPGSVRWSVREG